MWVPMLGVLVPILLWSSLAEASLESKVTTVANATSNRQTRLFSAFNVVRFPNTACNGGSNYNGTCFTASECTSKGGQSSGSCASGYGVCCVFSLNCGGTSSQNCTYFVSTGSEVGECSVEICPCNNNICQLRLDFNTFSITGPDTSSVTVGKVLNGQILTGGKPASLQTECLTDTFSVTNPGGGAPPVICGLNTGQHMYVDASKECNDLAFQLGSVGIGTALATKQWNIKVTQYSCDYNNLAPEGCTQYYFGQTSATVQTYNFAGGMHLANQDQNICVRRERGNCRICWSATNPTDFKVSGTKSTAKNKLTCCQWGTKGTNTKTAYDCAIIPGAYTASKTSITKPGIDRFCGRSKGLASKTTAGKAATICSDQLPFSVRFLSDNFEYMKEYIAGKAEVGFRLAYIQMSTPCGALALKGQPRQTPDGTTTNG